MAPVDFNGKNIQQMHENMYFSFQKPAFPWLKIILKDSQA